MNRNKLKSFFCSCLLWLSISHADAQCPPKPTVTLVQPSGIGGGTITITNLPTGAASSVTTGFNTGGGTFEFGKTVYGGTTGLYTVTVQLNGCQAKTIVKLDRNGYRIPEPTCYRIVNKTTGKVLEAPSNTEGATIRQATPTGAANQLWERIRYIDGVYNWVSKSNGKFLGLTNPTDCPDGLQVKQFADNSGDNQKWRIEQQTNGAYKIFNFYCIKPIAAENNSTVAGANAVITSATGANEWTLEAFTCPPDCNTTPAISGNDFVCVGSNLNLTGTSTTGTTQWSSSDNSIATVSSSGVVTSLKAGSVTITYKITSGTCIGTATKTIGVTAVLPAIQTTIVNPSDINSGSITVTNLPTGALANLYLNGAGGNPLQSFSGLDAGEYTIKVTFNGCETSKIVTLVSASTTAFDPTKCYRIVNKESGKVLEVKDASTAEGATIYQWSITGKAQQLWQFARGTYNGYRMIAKHSGKVIDAANCVDGGLVQQFAIDGTGSQEWKFEKQADGSYKISNISCNTLFLKLQTSNTADGTDVGVNYDYGTESFKWLIQEAACSGTPPPPPPATFDPTKCYRLIARHSGKVAEIAEHSFANGVNIQQGTWGYSRRQVWRIKSIDGTYYQVMNGYSGEVMDVKGDFTYDGANIQQGIKNGGDNQKWRFDKNTEGYYFMTAKHSGKVADVKAVSTADGANIQQSTKNGGQNQQWTVSEIGCPAGVASAQTAEIYSADGYRDGRKGIITWLSNAANADYFTLEKQNKNGVFEKLTTVNAKPVVGFSDKNYYSYTDNETVEGENTYRVALVADNAPPQYSSPILLNFKTLTDFALYPNPTSDYVEIDLMSYQDRAVVLTVIDASGKEVRLLKIDKAAKTQRLELDGLTTGQYIIRIQTVGKRDVTRLLNLTK
jgi:Ricin-type beta-trefoil lectin domain-like/Secretion system C-terminal sorting domain/Bacterial Ig-like domain (group 2)